MNAHVIFEIVDGALVVVLLIVVVLLHFDTIRLRKEFRECACKADEKISLLEIKNSELSMRLDQNWNKLEVLKNEFETSKKDIKNSISNCIEKNDYHLKQAELVSRLELDESKISLLEKDANNFANNVKIELENLKDKDRKLNDQMHLTLSSLSNSLSDILKKLEILNSTVKSLEDKYKELLMDCSFTTPAIEIDLSEGLERIQNVPLTGENVFKKSSETFIKTCPKNNSKQCPYWFYVE